MKKLTRADYVAMPWKNGGGVTAQLMIAPDGASIDNFDWRVSSAQVAGSGPFSFFPGIDRSIAVMEGGGMKLDYGGSVVTLDKTSAPFAFRGEEAITATLIDGPLTDFNVMTRRMRWSHALQVLELHGAHEPETSADLLLIHCAAGILHCRDAHGEETDCEAGDTIVIDSRANLHAPARARLYLVHLTFKGNPDDRKP